MRSVYRFSAFEMDLPKRVLRHEGTPVAILPHAFDLLAYLIRHQHRVVDGEELFRVLWPDTRVSKGSLRICVHECRRALRDTDATKRFVATVHGRGLRFVGEATAEVGSGESSAGPAEFVGRHAELEALHEAWLRVESGESEIALLAGEAGMGKTTLANRAIQRLPAHVPVLRGACREAYRQEAYLPLIDALATQFDDSATRTRLAMLRRCAPAWIPSLRPHDLTGASMTTPYGMIREGVRLLQALARDQPLILFIDDVGWADAATLELVETLAGTRDAAPLLVILTCRNRDASTSGVLGRLHTLSARGLAIEVTLHPLTATDEHEYLQRRFGAATADRVREYVYRWSAGNPLLMNLATNELARHGETVLPEGDALPAGPVPVAAPPITLRHWVDQDLARRSPVEVAVLEAASVCSNDLHSLLLASLCSDTARPEVEETCRRLAATTPYLQERDSPSPQQSRFGESYEFRHQLYRECLYARLLPAQREAAHRHAAEWLESQHGSRADEIATTLAHHYAAGADPERAALQMETAAFADLRRYATTDAAEKLTMTLAYLSAIPSSPETLLREARLYHLLGDLRGTIAGPSVPEVRIAYLRSRDTYARLGNVRERLRATFGLCSTYLAAGDFHGYDQHSVDLVPLADDECPALRPQAYTFRAIQLLHAGEITAALDLFERAAALNAEIGFPVVIDIITMMLTNQALALCVKGEVNEALAIRDRVVEHARLQGVIPALLFALTSAAEISMHARDTKRQSEFCAEVAGLSERYGLPIYGNGSQMISLASSMPPDESKVREAEEGLRQRTLRSEFYRDSIMHGILAEAVLARGDCERAAEFVEGGMTSAEQRGELLFIAELERLRGEVAMARHGLDAKAEAAGPEAHFRKAAEIADRQGAHLWKLRACSSLAKLLARTQRPDDAREQLHRVLAHFDESEAFPDLDDARRLLATGIVG